MEQPTTPEPLAGRELYKGPRANPWMTTLWFLAVGLVIGGALLLGGVMGAPSIASATVLASIGSSMITAGFLALVLGAAVAAVRWKP